MSEAGGFTWRGIDSLVDDRDELRDDFRLDPADEVGRRVWPLRRKLGVTRVAEITDLDRLGVPVVVATRAGAAVGQNTSVQGCGPTREHATTSALMEAVERHSAALPRPVRRGTVAEIEAERLRVITPTRLHANTCDEPLEWITARCLSDGEQALLPAAEVLFPYHPPPGITRPLRPSTSGLASGSSLAEAVLHALFEVIERHAVSNFVLDGDASMIDLDALEEPELELVTRLRSSEIELLAVKLVAIIPTVKLFSIDRAFGHTHLAVAGQSAHIDPRRALRRAIYELLQSRLIAIQGSREDLVRHASEWNADEDLLAARFTLLREIVERSGRSTFMQLPAVRERSLRALLRQLCERLAAAGFDEVLWTDLSDPAVGIPVVHVCVPGMHDSVIEPGRARHA